MTDEVINQIMYYARRGCRRDKAEECQRKINLIKAREFREKMKTETDPVLLRRMKCTIDNLEGRRVTVPLSLNCED